jgi:hypothetical protein
MGSYNLGVFLIKVGQGTFSVKEISVHSEEGPGGHLTWKGYFKPYPFNSEEESQTFIKVRNDKFFRMIKLGEELPCKCKMNRDDHGIIYFNCMGES